MHYDERRSDNRGPHLRLFRFDDDGHEPNDPTALSESMPLTAFYARYVLPICLEPRGVSPLTVKEDRQALRYWALFVGDPPLREIGQETCAKFLRRMAWLPARQRAKWPEADFVSPNTVRKHCTHLQRMLNLAGTPGPANRLGADLLVRVPWLDPPPAVHDEPHEVFTLNEIGLWLDACELADTPPIPGVSPPCFWRALIVWMTNVGTRIATTVKIEWSMIHEEEGRHWLRAPSRIMKRRNAKTVYVNQRAWEAANAIRTNDARLFPWPYTMGYMQVARRNLLAKSCIRPCRQFGFHALRRLLATEVAAGNPLVAQKQLGHTAQAVTRDSYVHSRAMSAAMEAVPQPKRTARRGDTRQMWLF